MRYGGCSGIAAIGSGVSTDPHPFGPSRGGPRDLVLLPTPSGTRRFVSAHNTVDGQMHVVGSIVFFWYGKYRRLPYCRTNIGAHNTIRVLTCLEGYKVPL